MEGGNDELTGVVERARGGLGVDVVGDPAGGRIHGGEAGADFVPYVLFPVVITVGRSL